MRHSTATVSTFREAALCPRIQIAVTPTMVSRMPARCSSAPSSQRCPFSREAHHVCMCCSLLKLLLSWPRFLVLTPACSPLLIQELKIPTQAPAERRIPGALRCQSTSRTSPPALLLVALLLLAAPAEGSSCRGAGVIGAPASALQQAATFGLLLVGMAQQVEGAGMNTVGNAGESCETCCTRVGSACQASVPGPRTDAEMTQLGTALSLGCTSYYDYAGYPSTAPKYPSVLTSPSDSECGYDSQNGLSNTFTCEGTNGVRVCPCYLCSTGKKKSGSSCIQCEAGKYNDVPDDTTCKE